MRRVPIGATIVVAIAIALMVGLGFWQLGRRAEKQALLARYAANATSPPIVVPPLPGDVMLFRRARATCAVAGPLRREAGRAADGSGGWRVIADCRAGFAVQLGVARGPMGGEAWAGGGVAGYLTQAPRHRALIAGLFDHTPAGAMIVSNTPLAGLRPNPAANLDDVPNNHLAYAVQWFLFAAIAAAIYGLALWRRGAVAVAGLRG